MWKTEFKSKELKRFFYWRRSACHDIGLDAPLLMSPFLWPRRNGDKLRSEDVDFWCKTLPGTLEEKCVKARGKANVALQELRNQLKVEILVRQKNALTTTVVILGLESLLKNAVPCCWTGMGSGK